MEVDKRAYCKTWKCAINVYIYLILLRVWCNQFI